MARRGDGGLLIGLVVGTALLWPIVALAEVATDGTLGAKVRLTGKDVKIPARLGQTRGKNLFHSFERFGIETGDKVTFTAPGRLKLKNVIGRVTGGERSTIDGTLASKVRGADFWLLNPAGILFGPNARLDVPGSFHASTADELRFADGAVFSALDPGGSVLSVAAPEAFGFLGAGLAGITVDRSLLEVRKGEALALVGGDIGIASGAVRAEAGRVTLAALDGLGAVSAATGEVSGNPFGRIRLSNQALVDVTGDGGGTVRIRGGQVVVENQSKVFADNSGPANAKGGVMIEAGTVAIDGASKITSDALNTGNAGPLMVIADTIELRDGVISSSAYWAGDAGAVTVATGHLLAVGEQIPFFTGVVSKADRGSTGHAGAVTIQADTVELHDTGQIGSSTYGSGDAGAVTVQADTIELRGGAITSSTFGLGYAGSVAVTAGSLTVVGNITTLYDAGVFSQSFTTDSPGPGGRVTVQAGTVELRDTGQISSSTGGSRDAGDVVVTAGRALIVGDIAIPGTSSIASQANPGSSGDAGEVTVRAGTIELLGNAAISSSTFGPGDGGEVAVTADGTLTIAGDSAVPYTAGITSQAFPGSTNLTGDAGRMTVRAGTIELRDTGVISSSSGGSGNAGTVMVNADDIEVHGTGEISSSTFGSGSAGEIAITAGSMTVADGGVVQTNSEQTSGAAGDVSVRARHLTARDGGLIGSSGTGSGPAGNVFLDVGTLEVEDASIRTEGKVSEGGRINAVAEDLSSLKNAEVTSSGIEPEAGRSVITLQAPLIALNDSRVTSLTGTGEPLAGSGLAELLGEVTVISPESFVAASSSVTLTGVEGDIGSRLVVPESVFLNVGDLLRESCAARRSGTASSFTAMGRGGQLPDPAGPLAGAYREPGGTMVAGLVEPGLAGTFGDGCR
jgi:filamentous hemagglutinin family protein